MKRITLLLITLLSAGILTAQAKHGNPLYKSGYQGYVDVSAGYHSNNSGMQTSLLTSHGYSTGFGLYAGLGTGVELTPEYVGTVLSLPLFLDLKYCFIDEDFSPYVGMRTGIAFSPENMRGGIYLAPSVGVDIKRHLSLFLKYDHSTTSYDILKFKKHAFSVGISVGF